MTLRAAVAGTGYWGVHLVRALAAQPGVEVVAIADPDPGRRAAALLAAPMARAVADLDGLLRADDVEAVAIATPARLHAGQACAALAAGKHVLVEKPMALSLADAERVRDAAGASGRVLAVGHLMVHHPAVAAVADLLARGELGEVHYLYSRRVNLGRLRSDENALWSFGPHDVSLVLHLLGQGPATVSAQGQAYLRPGIEDVVFLHLGFPDGKMAHVQLSWLDPRKERRLTIVGSRRMLELDDVEPRDKLRLFDRGYDRPPSFSGFGEYLRLRHGEVSVVPVSDEEPLAVECRAFVEAVTLGRPSPTDAAQGLEVVRVLEAAQASLRAGGAPVRLR